MTTKLVGLGGFTWRDVPPVVLLFFVMVWVYDWWEQRNRDQAPVEEYFEVTQLAVPDHHEGEDPRIVYDRIIRKSFRGEWVASIDTVGSSQLACSNAGIVDYAVDRQLPTGGPTLSWFMDRQCDLKPGNYRLSVCWEIQRVRASTAKVCRYTEPFSVAEKKHEG
jgi:hypothetical protein